MAMNGLHGILQCLEHGSGEIEVKEPIRSKALECILRMLDFTSTHPELLAKAQHGFIKNIGAA
jgi:quinolinate synthase